MCPKNFSLILLVLFVLRYIEPILYLNGTTLWTNHEISIRGLRIKESIMKIELAEFMLNQTVVELNEKLTTCQWRLNGLNETVMERKDKIRSLMDELDYLEVECFGKNRLHPDQCSGHGDCIDSNECACEEDWFGTDCQDGRWKQIETTLRPPARRLFTFVEYQDSLWVWGGILGLNFFDDLWQFHIGNQSWSEVTNIIEGPDARFVHTAVAYQDAMWMFGGWIINGSDHIYQDDLWAFNFSTSLWNEIEPPGQKPSARFAHSAVVYQDSMWIFGGQSEGVRLNDFWKFQFADSWINTEGIGPGVRLSHSAVVYQDSMWVFGGSLGSELENLYDAWKFNFTMSNWENVTSAISGAVPHIHYSSAVVYQDSVWIFGGREEDGMNRHELSKFFILELSWETIEKPGIAPTERRYHHGVVHEGVMWIFGGQGVGGALDELWRFIL